MLELLWRTARPVAAPTPRRLLRTLMQSDTVKTLPGVHDGLSARTCEAAGFECLLVGRQIIGNTLLGMPDVDLVTIDQLAAAVARISAVVAVPLVVDAGGGSGTCAGAAHTVHVLEKAGAAAVCLDDDANATDPGDRERRDPGGAMTQRLRAAARARTDPDLVLAVQCRADSAHDIAALMRRCNAHVENGAEIIRLGGPLSRAALAEFASGLRAPCLMLDLDPLGGDEANRTLTRNDLSAMGYRFVCAETSVVQAAAHSMTAFAVDLRARGIAADRDLLTKLEGLPLEDWYRFTGFDAIRAMEERFLPALSLEKYARGPESYYKPAAHVADEGETR